MAALYFWYGGGPVVAFDHLRPGSWDLLAVMTNQVQTDAATSEQSP